MSIIGTLRRAIAYRVYTPPNRIDGEGGLSTHGIVDIALNSREKRDIVRRMAYHMGSRRRYDPDGGGSYVIDSLSEFVRGDSLDVSTDPTDYEEMDEYYTTTREAKRRHLQESVLPDLVNTKVLEGITEDQEWVTHSDEINGEITGVRPGPRFEFAVQALRWIDLNGSERDWRSF